MSRDSRGGSAENGASAEIPLCWLDAICSALLVSFPSRSAD